MVLTLNSTEEVENENVSIVFSTTSMASVLSLPKRKSIERSEEERNKILIIAAALGIVFFVVFLLFCFVAAQLTKRKDREKEKERRARRLRALRRIKLRLRNIEKAKEAKEAKRKKALDDDQDVKSEPGSDPREVKEKVGKTRKKKSYSDVLGAGEIGDKVDRELWKRRRQAYDNMGEMDYDWESERAPKNEAKHSNVKGSTESSEEKQRGSKDAGQTGDEKPKGSKEAVKTGDEKPKGSKEAVKTGEEKPKGSKEAVKTGEEERKGSKEAAKSNEDIPRPALDDGGKKSTYKVGNLKCRILRLASVLMKQLVRVGETNEFRRKQASMSISVHMRVVLFQEIKYSIYV
ncbi:hypothetical protein Y032_0008g295 [Ancylostoma ceylanicum]|nr:hypothetical protein Y032_0008g295 [Ancylostoma ceylanicum]